MRKQFPDSKLILIEPIPWLQNFIDYIFRNKSLIVQPQNMLIKS